MHDPNVEARFTELITDGERLASAGHPLALVVAAYIALLRMEPTGEVLLEFQKRLTGILDLFGIKTEMAWEEDDHAAC